MRTVLSMMFVIAIGARGAAAQPEPAGPTAAPEAGSSSGPACEEAMRQTTQADEYLAESVFDLAIAQYTEAFGACPDRKFRAAMVFNMGLAYKRRAEAATEAAKTAGAEGTDRGTADQALNDRRAAVDDRKKALDRFRDFLNWMPEGRLSDEARSYVFRLQSDIDAEEAAIDTEAARLADERAAEQRSLAQAQRERARRRRWQLASAVVAGVGVGLAGTGAYYGWRAHTLSRELSTLDDWTPAAESDLAAGQRAEGRMIVFTASGGIAVVTAGVLFWYAHRDRGAGEAHALTAVITSRGLAVAGRF